MLGSGCVPRPEDKIPEAASSPHCLAASRLRGRSRRVQQPDRVRLIGILMGYPDTDLGGQAYVVAFQEGLKQFGWTMGRNVRIDTRWAPPGNAEALQRFAIELVAQQPDLILSHSTPTTAALLQQTRSIPIIFAFVSDPLGSGFVASFPHPGGNVTGFIVMEPGLAGKWFGAAQGDCAARRPGRVLIPFRNRGLF
jgi:ABC transporter substrate binding protein